jgi:hypothetical protein
MRRCDLIGLSLGLSLGLSISLSATASSAAPLGKYTFENSAGAFTDSGTVTAPGMSLSAFGNGSGVVGLGGSSGNPGLAYQSNGWTNLTETARRDFLTFTVQPINDARFIINQILFDSKRGAGTETSGPQSWALRSSIDNFMDELDSGSLGSTNTWQPIAANIVGMPTQVRSVVFRLYGYGGNGSATRNNFWSVDNVSINGSVSRDASAVPTPAAIPAIVGFGVSLWRKRRAIAV